MLDRPIAILGGGNAGHTHAAALTLAGYAVHFYEHPDLIKSRATGSNACFGDTLERKGIDLEEFKAGRREIARPRKITTDIKEAVSDAGFIFVVVPSYGQELFFNAMIPHLKDGQVVFVWTGNFGSLRLRQLLRKKAPKLRITVYETNTQPFGTRLTGPATVLMNWGFGPWFTKKSMEGFPEMDDLVAALPASDNNVALKDFLKLYSLFKPAQNVLCASLMNPNFFCHPAAALLNIGRIEYANFMNEEFRLHSEAHSKSVVAVEQAIADEANEVIKALGGKRLVSRDISKNYAAFQWMLPRRDISLGPWHAKDRYITEDVPYGLVPHSQLAKKLGVPTPTIDAVIQLCSIINSDDYQNTGRTLKSMGLDKLNKNQILNYVEKG